MPAPRRRTRTRRRLVIATTAIVLPVGLWSIVPLGAVGADQGQVEKRIENGKAQERSLSSAAARLAKLEDLAQKGIAVLERRQAAAQTELDAWQTRLDRTETRLTASRERLADQKRRLRKDRQVLADNLRAAYLDQRPDLATVILRSDGFADLLERVEYEANTRDANQRILAGVREAKADTDRLERSLQKIVPEQREATAAVRRERDAVAARAGALTARKAALAQAKAARLAALRSTRADRKRAQRTLVRLIAAQKSAAVDKSGPGGPWAIPWAIVQCESGGQNLPPNSASASGYYQFLASTWKGLGGSTPAAYLAGKAEQDRLAAKLWAGGAGARNWDCAAIVGLI